MGGGWIGAKAGGKCGRAARLAEAHVNGFNKGDGNSLAGKAHHGRVGALNGSGLKLSKALEHLLGMLAQLAISRDNKGVKALTATLADRFILGQLGLFNTGQDRVWVTGSISGAVEVNDADICDGSGAQLMEAADANVPTDLATSLLRSSVSGS